MTVGGEAVLQGLETNEFRQFPEGRGLGETQYAILPQVRMPGTPAKRGSHQPESGYVVQPAAQSRTIEILGYNTSDPLRDANVSHAEKQVTNFLENQPVAWLKRVERVEFVVVGREICERCAGGIKQFTRYLSKIRQLAGLPAPTIVILTSPENINR